MRYDSTVKDANGKAVRYGLRDCANDLAFLLSYHKQTTFPAHIVDSVQPHFAAYQKDGEIAFSDAAQAVFDAATYLRTTLK